MLRLENAQRILTSYMNDRLAFRGNRPEEVEGLAKIREALALITEARLIFGSLDGREPCPHFTENSSAVARAIYEMRHRDDKT